MIYKMFKKKKKKLLPSLQVVKHLLLNESRYHTKYDKEEW